MKRVNPVLCCLARHATAQGCRYICNELCWAHADTVRGKSLQNVQDWIVVHCSNVNAKREVRACTPQHREQPSSELTQRAAQL